MSKGTAQAADTVRRPLTVTYVIPQDLDVGCQSLRELVGRDRATVTEVLAAQARHSPRNRFIVGEHRTWTYAEAFEQLSAYADLFSRLREQGATSRIACFLSLRPEALWTWFGANLAGGIYAALNFAHRGLVLADQLRRCGSNVLITEASGLPHLPSLPELGIRFLIVIDQDQVPVSAPVPDVLAFGPNALRESASVRTSEQRPSDTASLLFTSGTTGRSKAVLIPHNQLCRGGGRVAEAFGLRPTDLCHSWVPLWHIGGQLDVVMSAAVSASGIALIPRFSASEFWSQVAGTGSTYFVAFANVLRILMSQSEAHDGQRTQSLRLALIAGARAEELSAFEERFGVQTVDAYGMTEAEPLALRGPNCPAPIGSVGAPTPDFEVEIHDDTGRVLPPRSRGRVVVRPRVTDVMMQGYEGDEATTANVWRDGWFQTRDMGWRDEEGFVYFSGREAHAIRTRGENISAQELEAVVLEHAAVRECAVVGVPSPWGDQDIKVVVAPKQGLSVEPKELIGFLSTRVARFMVPRYIELVDSLPVSDLGKLRYDLLQKVDTSTWDAAREGAERPSTSNPNSR